MSDKYFKFTEQDFKLLADLQEHPGWDVFKGHLERKIKTSDTVSNIDAKSLSDVEVSQKVKLAQSKMSVYSGLIGFMKDIKFKNNREV